MAFAKYSVADNAFGRLSAGINNSVTSFDLVSSQNLPAANRIGTLVQFDISNQVVRQEKVLVATFGWVTCTVTRWFDGSTAQAFDANDYIFLNHVASVTKDMQDEITRLWGLVWKRTRIEAAVSPDTNEITNSSTSDELIVAVPSTSAAVTVTLMSSLVADTRIKTITVKDESGACVTNNITIVTEWSEKIDGQDTFVMDSNYQSTTLYHNGTNRFIQ